MQIGLHQHLVTHWSAAYKITAEQVSSEQGFGKPGQGASTEGPAGMTVVVGRWVGGGLVTQGNSHRRQGY